MKKTSMDSLFEVSDKLLAPGGCPWDQEQTPQTLAPFAIEEAHELAEAIESGDIAAIKEELGDLLYQVVFHSSLAKRLGQFDFSDVVEAICSKLVRRHPHVFGTAQVKDSDEVLKNWETIKKAEKPNSKKEVFKIPQSLPALQRAQKIGDKTKHLKFDWKNPSEVFEKVREEFDELQSAFKQNDLIHTKEELGDLFFVLAQLARHLKLDAETVARAANRKFEDRFKKLLGLAEKRSLDFESLPDDEKEKLWEEIKK